MSKLPRQIPFIIANEGCERYSFYGMRNILQPFLAATLLATAADPKIAAKDTFHTFVMGVYFFPLLGGWLSDRFFGKFNTIFWFSLIYCAGQACLTFFVDDLTGFSVGLGLIALGSGGIKPLVASFVGDQFDAETKPLAKIVFDAFYWIINFGSFFATLFASFTLHHYGPRVAFGIPGVLMLIATIVFVAGRPRYVMIPPAKPDAHSFVRVARTAITSTGTSMLVALLGVAAAACAFLLVGHADLVAVICLALVILLAAGGIAASLGLDHIRGKHPDEAIEGVRAVLRILIAFALCTPFFSLFDQKATTWVIQGGELSKPSWFAPEMMQALNPALVMLLIPLNNLVLFPWLRARGWEPTPLRRMTTGIACAGIAWIIVGAMQLALDGGTDLAITWQIIPYVFLTLGEVLVSATGLEFAYSQAPPSMKGVIMSFWNLVVTIGSLWVLLSDASVKTTWVATRVTDTGLSVTAFQMFFFAGFALVAATAFGAYAKRYKMADHYRV
ncbi:MAG TPA: oligopeptide:H+ symporter [Kofleriaceae bacterium]|nr:oligopeptide:H+ symporter [Kofleriaceae bacterium]